MGGPAVISGDRWPLVSASQMRQLDRHTIDVLGVPGQLLMETAGHSVVAAALDLLSEDARHPAVAVLCGAGNNGGDGYVIARQLHALGIPVRAVALGEPPAGGDAALNRARARSAGVPIEAAPFAARDCTLIVDAIFGTGLTRAVSGVAAAAIERANEARAAGVRVLAVDMPSGIHSDTGQVLGVAISADCTVAISAPKLGLALEPGRTRAGRVRVARIGIADPSPEIPAEAELYTPRGAGALLPARPNDGHKGRFGHVLVVAGSEGKSGAAALAAVAAGRAGAGLVTIGCPQSLGDILEIKCTEAMTSGVAETRDRGFALAAVEPILALAAERDVVALGPGIGRADETIAFVHALAERVSNPLVIDADGLFALAANPAVLKAREAPTILTPHPGEAARLLRIGAAEVNADRVAAARELAALTGSIVVLKGAATVTAEPSGRVVVNPTGGPALATGGTGDVLTGIVAALLAQACEPFEAASLAAYLHGAAADRCARRLGAVGVLAGDVAAELPGAAQALRASGRRETAGSDDGACGRSDAAIRIDGTSRVAAGLLLDFPGS